MKSSLLHESFQPLVYHFLSCLFLPPDEEIEEFRLALGGQVPEDGSISGAQPDLDFNSSDESERFVEIGKHAKGVLIQNIFSMKCV